MCRSSPVPHWRFLDFGVSRLELDIRMLVVLAKEVGEIWRTSPVDTWEVGMWSSYSSCLVAAAERKVSIQSTQSSKPPTRHTA